MLGGYVIHHHGMLTMFFITAVLQLITLIPLVCLSPYVPTEVQITDDVVSTIPWCMPVYLSVDVCAIVSDVRSQIHCYVCQVDEKCDGRRDEVCGMEPDVDTAIQLSPILLNPLQLQDSPSTDQETSQV